MNSVIASSASDVSPGSPRVNLLGLPPAAMEQFFDVVGAKKFRAQQVL